MKPAGLGKVVSLLMWAIVYSIAQYSYEYCSPTGKDYDWQALHPQAVTIHSKLMHAYVAGQAGAVVVNYTRRDYTRPV